MKLLLLTPCITDFVDEYFDGKKLWPSDPFLKAQGKLIVEGFGNKVSHKQAIAFLLHSMYPCNKLKICLL